MSLKHELHADRNELSSDHWPGHFERSTQTFNLQQDVADGHISQRLQVGYALLTTAMKYCLPLNPSCSHHQGGPHGPRRHQTMRGVAAALYTM